VARAKGGHSRTLGTWSEQHLKEKSKKLLAKLVSKACDECLKGICGVARKEVCRFFLLFFPHFPSFLLIPNYQVFGDKSVPDNFVDYFTGTRSANQSFCDDTFKLEYCGLEKIM
jgi:hypothetical protein